jgi:AmiR/NasT family two-component response regulator
MGTSAEFETVLSERHTVAIATGMLMQRCKLRHSDASTRLRQVALVSKMSLFEAAWDVIGTQPRPVRPESN